MSWLLLVNSLLVLVVTLNAKKCDQTKFLNCLANVTFHDGFAFNALNESQLLEDCESKLDAINCTKDYVSNCLSTYEKEFIKLTLSGKIEFIESLCYVGAPLNKENQDCWSKTKQDTEFCIGMYQQADKMIRESDLKEDMKTFHSCCALDWLKQCKTKAIQIRCNEDAVGYIKTVMDMTYGPVYDKTCGQVTNQVFTNCYELYGVEVADLDDLFSSSNALKIPVLIYLLLIVLQLIVL